MMSLFVSFIVFNLKPYHYIYKSCCSYPHLLSFSDLLFISFPLGPRDALPIFLKVLLCSNSFCFLFWFHMYRIWCENDERDL
uniref:Uncharacterized protein n=1 Tax=Cannabis sativa TaxID=3483 RepID=A0A803RBD4_CANSA